MSDKLLLNGFGDELMKLSVDLSPKAVMGRIKAEEAQRPKVKTSPTPMPRPAPGTRVPAAVPRTVTPKPYIKPPSPTKTRAEGVVKGTFQRRMPALPSGQKMPKPSAYISQVGSRKKWEKATKQKLPGWLSESMKRPVKGHPMATPEAVARSKRETAEARKLIAGYMKDQPKKRGRRKQMLALGKYHPSRLIEQGLKRMPAAGGALGTAIGRTLKDPGKTLGGLASRAYGGLMGAAKTVGPAAQRARMAQAAQRAKGMRVARTSSSVEDFRKKTGRSMTAGEEAEYSRARKAKGPVYKEHLKPRTSPAPKRRRVSTARDVYTGHLQRTI